LRSHADELLLTVALKIAVLLDDLKIGEVLPGEISEELQQGKKLIRVG